MTAEILKTPDQWAIHFKLHSCIGNKKFAKQIKEIQDNAKSVGWGEGYEEGYRSGYSQAIDWNLAWL